MTIAVPKEIRDKVRQSIWDRADELNWTGLSDLDRANWYDSWSRDRDIGGILSHFMDARKVRVYIKDSLLKAYLRTRLEDGSGPVLRAAGVDDVLAVAVYQKPHGRLLSDGRVICWGSSRDWKAVVISVFERAYRLDASVTPYAAILVESGRTVDESVRTMIRSVAERLGIERALWVE